MSISYFRSDSEVQTSQDLINAVQTWLGVAIGDFNRYSQAQIIQALNLGQNKFTLLTECLTMPVLIVCQNNVANYLLPDCVQKVQSGRYYFGTDRMSYQELTIKGSMKELQDEVVDFRGDTGSPAYYMFPSYRGKLVQVGISLFPSVDGTTFNATNSGVTAFEPGSVWPGMAVGAAKIAGASFIDSTGRDMTSLGVTVGLPIFNATNTGQLSGVITSITTTNSANDTLVAAMGGNWAINDQAVIPLTNWGLAVDIPADTLWTIATGAADITPLTDNLMMDVVRKPMPINANYLSMIPEIDPDYTEAAVAWAVYLLGRAKHKGLEQTDKAADAKARFDELVEEFKEQMPFQSESESATVYYDIYS